MSGIAYACASESVVLDVTGYKRTLDIGPGEAVFVSSEQVYEMRMVMARDGIPQGGQPGYSLFEEASITLSPAMHRVNVNRALEGELAILEEVWREAEEIASIADRLLIPERVENLLNRFRREILGGSTPEEALAQLEDLESGKE